MNLPTGTVTLLFAEVERGSARLDGMPDAHLPVSSLRQALVYALHAHNGHVLSMDDDSLRAAFSTPTAALEMAVAIQQIFHPEREEIPVEARSSVRRFCVALHTDRVQVEEGTYVGAAVEHTAQLLAAGHSGQILVSAACAGALQNLWPSGVQLHNLGQFQYAGQAEGEAVFQVLHADLPELFPPLRLAGASATNLPIPWTAFVGRETEITELKRLLANTRILTLIGAEGIGKSRLALRLASDLRGAFPDGVWLAELPAIADTDIVPGAVAAALNAQTGLETPLTDALITRLRNQKALLVLDAGESKLAACARLVTALAGACPTVKFVISARKGLGLRDEAISCVAPLSLDNGQGGSEAEQLCRNRVAQLPVPPDLGGPAPAILCSLLQGIPLALELAIGGLAARPEDSIVGLTRSLHALSEGPERSWEQTLQYVLDWGHLRLSETERILLERLSVFQSGWSLEAATAVCCDDLLPSELLPALLESLRAGAFLAVEERAGFTRERLCEAVRIDAEARLTRRGEAAEYRRRHAEYFLQLAEQGALGLTGPDQEAWKIYLEREYLNFRAALLHAHQDTEGAQELRLATALVPIFAGSGRPSEGRTLLARASESPRVANARIEEYPTARARFFDAIERCRTVGDLPKEQRYLNSLAGLAQSNHDFATALHCYELALSLFREQSDQAQEARTLHCLGSAAREGGEYARARHHYEDALKLNRSLGRRTDEAHNLNGLARVALLEGNSAEAARRFQEGMLLFHALGERAWEAHNMGQILRLSLPDEPLWERHPAHSGAEK